MSCLFCGKEIGALRLLRKEEFCSSVHRRLYRERLGKVLGDIGAPAPPPAPVAGFRSILKPRDGRPQPSACLHEFRAPLHDATVRSDWPVAIPPVTGSHCLLGVPVSAAAPCPAASRCFPLPVAQAAPATAPVVSQSVVSLSAAPAHRPAPVAVLTAGLRQEIAGRLARPNCAPAMAPARADGHLPGFDIAAKLEPLAPPAASAPPPADMASWLTAPSAAPADCLALPAVAASAPFAAAAPALPPAAEPPQPGATLRLPKCTAWALPPCPVAALVDATLRLEGEPVIHSLVRLPALPAWQAQDSAREAHAGASQAPAPQAVETWPALEPCAPLPALGTPPLSVPVPALRALPGRARLECSSEHDLAPRPALPAPAAAPATVANPLAAPPPAPAARRLGMAPAGTPAARMGRAPFAIIDFHCRPKPGTVSANPLWILPAVALQRPAMSVRPLFDRWEDLATATASAPRPGAAELQNLRRAIVRIAASKQTRHMVGSVAAGLFLGIALWMGATSRQRAREHSLDLAVNETQVAPAPARTAPRGAMSRLRQAISDRAAASWSDTFRGGMGAWGSGPKSWAPGWTRSSEGFVQPGSLAIFQPTVDYSDYRLEFLAQIEHKSMDWVFRARDAKNYYAMKLTVVEPGPRPMVAMAHYSVVAGKRSKYSQTPLDIMVHNGRPMQVLVDVKGNRFTASVDGQEVGSWSDNALPTGGVGFFADAGEKARLYWMRVSKNEDLLGHICAYLTGSSNKQTAELRPGDPFGRSHGGAPGAPVEPAEAVCLAGAVTARRGRRGQLEYHAASHFREGGIETWRS